MFYIKSIKAIIFGAGLGGRKLTEYLKNKTTTPPHIVAYADNDPKIQGGTLLGKPVISPANIKEYTYDRILIATTDTYNVERQLLELGVNAADIDSNIFSDNIDNVENQARLDSLKCSAKLIYDMRIPGATAELGVFQGEFAKHINECFPDRTLYLFDTFEGFPEADVQKEKELGTKRVLERSYNFLGMDTELILSKMKFRDNCIIKKGYFPDTAHGLEENFAFVNLDADLYQPMLAGLLYFYPRMSPGGIILIHDYFSEDFTGVQHAISEFREKYAAPLSPVGDNCSVIITKI